MCQCNNPMITWAYYCCLITVSYQDREQESRSKEQETEETRGSHVRWPTLRSPRSSEIHHIDGNSSTHFQKLVPKLLPRRLRFRPPLHYFGAIFLAELNVGDWSILLGGCGAETNSVPVQINIAKCDLNAYGVHMSTQFRYHISHLSLHF